jgi:hypothetical protein
MTLSRFCIDLLERANLQLIWIRNVEGRKRKLNIVFGFNKGGRRGRKREEGKKI